MSGCRVAAEEGEWRRVYRADAVEKLVYEALRPFIALGGVVLGHTEAASDLHDYLVVNQAPAEEFSQARGDLASAAAILARDGYRAHLGGDRNFVCGITHPRASVLNWGRRLAS